LNNSIQSVENKGTITIITKKNPDNIQIEILDNGCGIRKDILSKVMDPFFTTKEPGKGTGLGLSISYNIIKGHKGTIEIDSEPNVGTSVKITLPLNPV
jgi:signal transduction histidine kinase